MREFIKMLSGDLIPITYDETDFYPNILSKVEELIPIKPNERIKLFRYFNDTEIQ